MRPGVSDATVGALLDVFSMSNAFLRASVADIPEARMTEQPGAIVNHPAWTLSHLNAYRALLLSMLGDMREAAAGTEIERFGYGTTPAADPAAYPSKHELLAVFDDRHARIVAMVAQRHAEYFPRPAPARFHPHAPTIGHLAVIWMTTHEGHHLGQLRQWRRAAGLAN